MTGFGSILKDYLEYFHITQTDFAHRLGISVKHMNEIINGNTNISPDLMISISVITGIDIKVIFDLEYKRIISKSLNKRFKNDLEIAAYLDSFYLKEMVQKGWIVLKDKTSLIQNAVDLLNFLQVKDFDVFENYVNQKILFKKKDDANSKKIYLWLKHCEKKLPLTGLKTYSPAKIPELLNVLKEESQLPFDCQRLIKILHKYGILLVIEDALEGTKVRGCSLIVGKNPVIYLTTNLKEKAIFYFTLYHELGHIKMNYNQLINHIIIDDDKETKADIFALEQMIDRRVWEEITNNMANKDNIVREKNIPLSFLYMRLAYENIISYNSQEYQTHREKISLNCKNISNK